MEILSVKDETSLPRDVLSNKLQMPDFCDMQVFDQLIRDWSTSTGLAAVAIGSNGKYISGYYNFTDFCEKLTRKSPEGLRRCTECDKTGWGTYLCHAGLVDFAAPITLEDGTVLGNMLGGQVLPESPDEVQFRATARELGIDEDAYIDALRKVNVRTTEEIKAAANLLATIVNSFVRSSYMAQQNKETLMARTDIITSLSKLFFCDYYINIKADQFLELDATEELHDFTGQSGQASEFLTKGCRYFAQPEYWEEFEEFIDLSTLPVRLAKRQSVSYEFVGSSLGWCRSTFIVAHRDVSGIVTHVIYAVQVVQEEKEKELHMLETLKRTTAEAVRANEVKSDFLARMSHDMRTPLTTIIGLSDLAVSRYQDQQVLRDFQTIKSSSEYLLNLVSDVLDMQKLSSGTVKLNPVICRNADVAGVVKNIIGMAAAEKNIDFQTEFNCRNMTAFCKTDTKHVRRVVMNLLNNAVKYTQPGGCVNWLIQVGAERQGIVDIIHIISDNGPGMSADFMKTMYDPFVQADNTQTGQGHGLGLAIVKKLVDLMGGSIECQSVIGQGTSFTVTIPCALADAKEIAAYEQSEQSVAVEAVYDGRHILVCEDNQVNAEIIRDILGLKNIITDHACNGSEAVQMVSVNKYDVILMDIMMPVMDGYEAARKIRKFNQAIPIIALSANSFPDDVDKSLASGMNAHLSKPINIDKLFLTLQQVMH